MTRINSTVDFLRERLLHSLSLSLLASPILFGESAMGQSDEVMLASAVLQPIVHDTTIVESFASPPEMAAEIQPRTSPDKIASLASWRACAMDLMKRDLQADQAASKHPTSRERATFQLRRCMQQYRSARQSQLAAAQALQLHFGIALIEEVMPIQAESLKFLAMNQQRQDRASEYGLSIPDPSAMQRLETVVRDKQIELTSKASQFRSQLILLVGEADGQCHLPELMTLPVADDSNVDDLIQFAYGQRQDLQGLIYLRNSLSVETLDVARWTSDMLTGSVPASITKFSGGKCSWIRVLFSSHHQDEEAELCARLAILDQAIAALKEKIASEVRVAYEKKRAAYERYQLAGQVVQLWKTRIEQLEKYGDQVKPLLVEELDATLSLYQAQADQVQRQGEWHQATVELNSALGF
jgi:hypothetical protein